MVEFKKYFLLALVALKKEYIGFLLLIIFGISIIWLGGMIAVVGSRRIAKPIQITISDAGGKKISSVRVFAKLARSGNAVSMTHDKERTERWFLESVFVEKIMIGVAGGDLSRVSNLKMTIGEKNFDFSDGARQLEKWKRFDKSAVRPYVQDEDYGNYIVAEAPELVRLEISRIPFRKNFFSHLVNWGGDDEVFVKPLIGGLSSIVIYILFLIIFRVVLLIGESQNIVLLDGDDGVIYRRKQFIHFVLTIIFSAITLILLNTLIYYFYKPDIGEILKDIPSTYLKYQLPAFLPKPVERLQFLLSVFFSPLILALFYYIVKNKLAGVQSPAVNFIYAKLSIIAVCLLFATAYLGLAMSDFLYVKNSYYFGGLGKYFFNLIIFPILFFVFIFQDKFLKSIQRPTKFVLKFIFYLALVLVLFMNVLNLGSSFSGFHFNPVFYPVAQVMAGKALLVNVTSLYGLFPLFLAPLFHIIGFGVFEFSLVMGIILCVSYILLFKFMRQAINNDLILYAGFLGMVFHSNFTSHEQPDVYLQYWPIRIIFPAVFLFITAIYLLNKNKYLYHTSFILFALGVLWNFDSGIIVFLSWMIVLAYCELLEDGGVATKCLKIARHILNSVVSLILAIFCFYLITYALSGRYPDFSLFLQYQKMFMSGYFMIPMLPPPHTWNLVALAYLCGLLLSIVALITKKAEREDKLIFALSILGIGLFSYYEGRSHDLTLFTPSYPALALAAIFTDKMYRRIKSNKFILRGEMLIFTFLFYIIASAPFNIIYNVKTYLNCALNGIVFSGQKNDSTYVKNIAFIKSNAGKGEGIFILAPHEGIYYSETGTYSIVDIPSSADLFFKREADLIVDFLENNKTNKVFVKQPLDFYDLYDSRIKKILEKRYVAVSTGAGGLSLYKAK